MVGTIEAVRTGKWADLPVFIVQVVLLSCALGIAVDLVTANVAVEYFTVYHPHVVDSDSPWVMALVWGIGASWWAGLALAPFLWWANVRRREPLPRWRLVAMVAKGMAAIWLVMMSIVLAVYMIGGLVPRDKRGETFEHDRRLVSVAMAHSTEYVLAVVVVVVLVFRIRRLPALEPQRDRTAGQDDPPGEGLEVRFRHSICGVWDSAYFSVGPCDELLWIGEDGTGALDRGMCGGGPETFHWEPAGQGKISVTDIRAWADVDDGLGWREFVTPGPVIVRWEFRPTKLHDGKVRTEMRLHTDPPGHLSFEGFEYSGPCASAPHKANP